MKRILVTTIFFVCGLSPAGAAPPYAAVRAVVRTALHHDRDVYAVMEGYKGLVAGGSFIAPMASQDVGGILQRGGSVIGSARSEEFKTRDGRRRAARNLLDCDIDALIVVGGDGSGLYLTYTTGQQVPFSVEITNVAWQGSVISFEANFPYEEYVMHGFSHGALTTSNSFASADALVPATLAAPAAIQVNNAL
jgi:hypothetical protein